LYTSDTVTLRKVTSTYVDGFPVKTVETAEVWADRHSVKSSIFFAAQAAGRQLDVAFTVNLDEYTGQTEIAHNGVIYEVVNTYELDGERIDLNCRRR
jgi:SPP1 family predicted phage head-tail adaptor